MKRISLLCWLAAIPMLLSACGGGGGGGGGAPELPKVELTTDPTSGCLIGDNAEAFTEYTLTDGATSARHLMWNCAEYPGYGINQVEMFLLHDDVDACFKVDQVDLRDPACDGTEAVLPIPEAVEQNTRLLVDAGPAPAGFGTPGFIYEVTTVNLGNVTAFGHAYQAGVDTGSGSYNSATSGADPLPPIVPGAIRYGGNGAASSASWNPGDTFTGRAVLQDASGVQVDDSLFEVTVTSPGG